MRKYLYGILALTVSLMAGVSLASCGGDDDDDSAGSGSAPTTAGVVNKTLGIRLTGYAGYTYYYAEDGRLTRISNGNVIYSFSYSPNKITYTDDGEDEEISVSYNGSGYITALSSSSSETEEDEKWTESSKASMSYDGSGHLTKVSTSYNDHGTDSDGDSWSESGNATYTYNWSSNRLTTITGSGEDNDEDGKQASSATFTYSYENATANPLLQMAPSIAHYITGDNEYDISLEELLAYAGFFGVGPAELPSSLTYKTSEYDGQSTYSGSDSFSYTFNDNGSLATARLQNSTHSFSYSYTTNEETDNSTAMVKTTKVGGLFLHKHKSSRK